MRYWLYAVAAYLVGSFVGMLTLIGTTTVMNDLVGEDVRPALHGIVGSLVLALGFAPVIGMALERTSRPGRAGISKAAGMIASGVAVFGTGQALMFVQQAVATEGILGWLALPVAAEIMWALPVIVIGGVAGLLGSRLARPPGHP